MIVFGIDGSLTATGFAVIETDGVRPARILATAAKYSTPKDGDDGARYRMMVKAAKYLVQRYKPDLVGLEMPYVPSVDSKDGKRKGNMQGALRLAGLKGAFEAALSEAGCDVVSVVTTSVSKALGIKNSGIGRAEKKRQAVQAIKDRYGLDVTDDKADAIGVCLAAVEKRRKQKSAKAQLGLGINAGPRKRRRETT